MNNGHDGPKHDGQKSNQKTKDNNTRSQASMGYGGTKVMKGESREKRAARAKARQGGAFVYQGAGKKHNKDATISEHKCEKHTLAVQWCLAKNDHKEDKCRGLVKRWRECTEKWDSIDPKTKRKDVSMPKR